VRFSAALVAAILFSALTASADAIVLKNGRRIVAVGVTEDGNHVSYETPAGRLSLPKSIVARIERDGQVPLDGSGTIAAPAFVPRAELVEGYGEVAQATLHDGSIDFAYLARLETEANSGSPAAATRLAVAEHVAAQHLVRQGDLDGAIDHYRRALIFAPDNLGLLLNLASLRLRRSEFTAALDPLEHARRVAPDSADVAKLLGWAYYGANRLDQAVEEWQRALRLHPDAEVEGALARAERDRAEESNYREGETAHFTLKYYGGANPALARGMLRALEDHFRQLSYDLDYSPPEPVAVILYTNQAFSDITRAPGWAGAINDGRIRVPVQGLDAVTPELSRVLKHELAHSFIAQKTRGRCPVWLQEGIAQWMEGGRSNGAAASLVAAAQQDALPSLASLEGSWLNLPGGSAALAYAWSLAAVEEIVESGGMSDLERLLDEIATVPSTDAALRATLHGNYADLEQQTLAYLRRRYLH
jgi:predicted negative regulator of RcsB-dependent stress response